MKTMVAKIGPSRGLGPVYWLALLGVASVAHAGPPFITDDPEPTDPHRWEIYNFATGVHERGADSLDGGLDLNYGARDDVQLTATLPFHRETGLPLDEGDMQLAVKYRFIHQRDAGWPVDIAFFPRAFLPTGRGSTRAQVLLPVWAQYNKGVWQVFGGGGYLINPGPGARNYWVQGLVAQRRVQPGWQVGLEEYFQSPAAQSERSVAGLNLGTLVHLKGPFSLIGSAGQGLNHRQSVFYAALKLDL